MLSPRSTPMSMRALLCLVDHAIRDEAVAGEGYIRWEVLYSSRRLPSEEQVIRRLHYLRDLD